MFGRWVFVRLNAAERAFREGRIDDACAAVLEADLRDDPRAQRLADALVRPLVSRARLHRQAGRYREALADLDRVAAIGREDPDAATLRAQVQAELEKEVARDGERRAAYERAAGELQAGRLETARLSVERVPDQAQRARLAGELDARRERSDQLVAQALDLLRRDDWFAAMACWRQACERHGRTQRVNEAAAQLAEAGRRSMENWLRDGRLDRLVALGAGIRDLELVRANVADCVQVVAVCVEALRAAHSEDYATLRQSLLRLKAAGGDASWLEAALRALEQIRDAQEAISASPLGLYAGLVEPLPGAGPAPGRVGHGGPTLRGPGRGAVDWRGGPDRRGAAAATAEAIHTDGPLLLLVDGGGSNLLLTADRVRIGRGGSSGAVDIRLAGLQAHHADILRHGDDYFLTAYGPAALNGQRAEHVLLRDGDQLTLGSGTKMVFRKPVAKSPSAVLRLSHRVRLAQDVSEIILFRETCLIGPGPGNHVRTRDAGAQIVLFDREGALCGRQTGGSGWDAAPAVPIAPGQPMEFGDLRITVTPYTPHDADGVA